MTSFIVTAILMLTMVVSAMAQTPAVVQTQQAVTRLAGSVTKLAGEVQALKGRKIPSSPKAIAGSKVFTNASLAEGFYTLAGYDEAEAKSLAATSDQKNGLKVINDRMVAAAERLSKVDQLEAGLATLAAEVADFRTLVNQKFGSVDSATQAVLLRVSKVETRQDQLIKAMSTGNKSMQKKFIGAGLGPSP